MRQSWLLTGLLVIMLALVAACGDDDDDDNNELEEAATEVVGEVTEAAEGDDAEATEEATATTADDMTTPTEDDGMTTETEDEGTPAGDEGASTEMDGTPTEAEADVTETDVDGTGTEDVDGTVTETDGTVTETEEADGTPTEMDGTAEATETEVDGTPSDDGATAETGEPIEIGDTVVTVMEGVVLDATTIGEFGGILGLEEGNQFVGVSLTVENAGSDPIAVTELLGRMHLEDGDGEEYGVDLGATALALLSGEFENVSQIDAGDEVPLMVGFQVPEEVQLDELTLIIESEDDTGEPTRVPLGEGTS